MIWCQETPMHADTQRANAHPNKSLHCLSIASYTTNTCTHKHTLKPMHMHMPNGTKCMPTWFKNNTHSQKKHIMIWCQETPRHADTQLANAHPNKCPHCLSIASYTTSASPFDDGEHLSIFCNSSDAHRTCHPEIILARKIPLAWLSQG